MFRSYENFDYIYYNAVFVTVTELFACCENQPIKQLLLRSMFFNKIIRLLYSLFRTIYLRLNNTNKIYKSGRFEPYPFKS